MCAAQGGGGGGECRRTPREKGMGACECIEIGQQIWGGGGGGGGELHAGMTGCWLAECSPSSAGLCEASRGRQVADGPLARAHGGGMTCRSRTSKREGGRDRAVAVIECSVGGRLLANMCWVAGLQEQGPGAPACE